LPCLRNRRDLRTDRDEIAITQRHVIEPRTPFEVEGTRFEAFPVEHSLRAPTVGFRITLGDAVMFYVPDVVVILDRRAALSGIKLYVGDGSAIARPIIRLCHGARIGHASIHQQLAWCAEEGVPKAIFTHCGSEIVRADGRTVAARIRGTRPFAWG
jgi:phosphoribosyl 1,2-cyclic phosphodiesterase